MKGNLRNIVGYVVMALGPCWATAADDQATAAERLLATQAAALTGSAELRSRLEDLRVEEALARASGAPGSPFLELQTEGRSSSLDRRPNAQDTVRVGAPFNLPGQTGSVRRHTEATAGRVSARRWAEELVAVAEASRRWLDLASVAERSAVLRERVARLEEALALQEAKFQLGEVAGTEVRQVDLEHVRESSRLASLDAELQARTQRLWEMCRDSCEGSAAGDLAALILVTQTPGAEKIADASVESGPIFVSAYLDAEAIRARSDLETSTAWGRPVIIAEWEHFPSFGELQGYNAWGLSLAVPLPLGREGRQRKVAAGAEAAAAVARTEATRVELESRMRAAYAAAVQAQSRLRVLEPVIDELPETEHSLREQFRLGSISYLVYIDGLSRLDDVRMECVGARAELLMARLELAVLLGDTGLFPLAVLTVEEDS